MSNVSQKVKGNDKPGEIVASSPDNAEGVVNHPGGGSPRASDTTRTGQNANISFFRSLGKYRADVFPSILTNFYLNLKDIFPFRLVSKEFNRMTSIFYTNHFVTINLDDLSKISEIPEDKIITLKLRKNAEIEALLVSPGTGLLNKVRALDLTEIDVTYSNVELVIKLLVEFKVLKGLSIGHVYTKLILPDGLDHLESLCIQGVNPKASMTLSRSLPKLKNLTIHYISDCALVDLLPNSLNNLINFTIGNLYTKLKLPELPSLRKLTIEGLFANNSYATEGYQVIAGYGCLELPKSLASLEYLSIDKIDDDVACHLSEVSFDSLRTLIIGRIGCSVVIALPKALNNLIDISMENIQGDTKFGLPASLDSLLNFSVKSLQSGAKIWFPKGLNNFQRLNIGDLGENVSINFSGEMPNFTNLKIRHIQQRATFTIPDSAINLQDLDIGEIGYTAKFKLLPSMPNLRRLGIRRISSNATCDLSTSLPELKSLTIGKSEGNTVIKFPNALTNLTDLTIQDLRNNSMLTSSLELPSLINLTLGEITANTLEFLSSIKTLKNLSIRSSISNKACLTLPESCSSLESIFVRRIDWGAELILPNTGLPNLKSFIMEENNSYDVILPDILDSLINLSIGNLRIDAEFKLPKSLKNLQSFSFEIVSDKEDREMIYSMKSLTKLSIRELHCKMKNLKKIVGLKDLCIGSITSKSTLILPISLESLTIKGIGKGAIIKLSEGLDQLKHLHIGCIDRIDQLKLLLSLLSRATNLTSVVIDEIKYDFSLKLPVSLINLEEFTINKIGSKVILELTDSHVGLKKITIGTVDYKSSFNLSSTSKSLDNLTTLIVGDMKEKSCLFVPDACCNLTTLVLGDIGAKATVNFPKSLERLEKLVIGYLECEQILNLPVSLRSLATLEIGCINGNAKVLDLPKLLPSLTGLMINGVVASLQLPNSTHGSRSFSVKYSSDEIYNGITRKHLNLINAAVNQPK